MELLEREAELAILKHLLDSTGAGVGAMVLVGGEAGAGKTSLVRQFAQEVADQARVLNVSCDGLSTPEPLGPLLDIAPALGLDVDRLFAPSVSRDHIYRAVLAAFDPGLSTVVIAEDAHWSDEASLGILRFFARHLDGRRLLIVVTARDDELATTHPLRRLIGDLASEPRFHRVSLRPFSAPTIRALASKTRLDPDDLMRRTSGNPFFVSEVMALNGAGVPPTVRDAVLARAARLSRPARAMLEVASALGSPIDLELLQELCGPGLEEIEECIGSGLLRADGDDVAFRHELARDAILESIAPPRRRSIHAAVLSSLRRHPERSRHLARLAHHAEAAGDAAATVEFATAAAEQATALHANREAAAQYARALRFAVSLPARELADLYERRSVACYLSDQGRDAIAAREAALAIRRRDGDRIAEGDNLRWLSRVHWFEGDRPAAEIAGRDAIRVLESEPPGPPLAMAYSNLSQLRMLALDADGAIAWGERAMLLATTLGEDETLVHAMINVGTARLQSGDPGGRSQIEKAARRARAAGMIDHAARAMTNLAWDSVISFDLAEAERRLDEAIAYATDHDLDNYRPYLLAHRALLQCRLGEWADALDRAESLLRRPTISPLSRIVALWVVGIIQSRRGEPAAIDTLDEALGLAEKTMEAQRYAPIRLARAEHAWLSGADERGRAELEALRGLAVRHGSPWLNGEIAEMSHRLGAEPFIPEPVAQPFAAQLSGHWDLAAAEWNARGCPWEMAVALLDGDEAAIRESFAIFERLDSKPGMARAARRLRERGARGIPRGPYAASRSNPAGLSGREVEVLSGLAEGLRNVDIAERLFISPKTVERHVTAILTKLDSRDRDEAVRAAIQIGLLKSEGSRVKTSG